MNWCFNAKESGTKWQLRILVKWAIAGVLNTNLPSLHEKLTLRAILSESYIVTRN